MFEIGDEVQVFKMKYDDNYHKKGEWKNATILSVYNNFYLVEMEKGKYKESFFSSEVRKYVNDRESGENSDI